MKDPLQMPVTSTAASQLFQSLRQCNLKFKFKAATEPEWQGHCSGNLKDGLQCQLMLLYSI